MATISTPFASAFAQSDGTIVSVEGGKSVSQRMSEDDAEQEKQQEQIAQFMDSFASDTIWSRENNSETTCVRCTARESIGETKGDQGAGVVQNLPCAILPLLLLVFEAEAEAEGTDLSKKPAYPNSDFGGKRSRSKEPDVDAEANRQGKQAHMANELAE